MKNQPCRLTPNAVQVQETPNLADLRVRALRDAERYLNNPEAVTWARLTFPRPARREVQRPGLRAA